MPHNLDISLIRSFVAVADHASMTAAGNALHLTQSTISQQIKRLEDMLGATLIERDRRGLRLTAAGERLFGEARKLLALNDEIWAQMTARAVQGKVRFGVPYDLIGSSLAPVLRSYAEAYPDVEISLVCGASPDLQKSLANGEIDLAVIEQPLEAATGECLSVERLVWVGARAGRAWQKKPLPISMVTETCAFRPFVLGALHEQGRQWRTVFENGNLDATRATVRMDIAISAWLAPTVPADLDILSGVHGLPDLPPFAITLHLRDRDASPAARELARHVREGLTRGRKAA